MTLRDIRMAAIVRMDSEVSRLMKDLAKMHTSHDALKQALFDSVKNLQESPSSTQLLQQAEELKKEISEIVISIHHLDARISKLKHRANRLRRFT